MMVEPRANVEVSTKNANAKHEAWGSKVIKNASAKREVWESEATESMCRNERSECRR